MSTLDRVLMNQEWEQQFPLVHLEAIAHIGSDHTPLLVSTGVKRDGRKNFSRFKPAWLYQEGFKEMVISKIPPRQNLEIQEYWKKFKK